MRLKPSLKNLVKPGLLFSLLCLFLSACSSKFEPTYKEEDIPSEIQKICQEEYSLDVVAQRLGGTLWVYIPLPKLLHEKFMVDKDKLFVEEVKEKLINILTSISRVILSADKTPEFYCLFASDIELGIDYGLIGYVQDLKKSSAGFIPYTEANRRYVIKFNIAPEAIGDRTGAHLELYDIKFTDFLSAQITQRIGAKFQEEELRPYFKVEGVDGKYQDGVFVFSYKVIELSPPPKLLNIQEEILKIIAYCLRTYEFSDFSKLSLVDLSTGNQTELGKLLLDKIRGF